MLLFFSVDLAEIECLEKYTESSETKVGYSKILNLTRETISSPIVRNAQIL